MTALRAELTTKPRPSEQRGDVQESYKSGDFAFAAQFWGHTWVQAVEILIA